VPAPGLPEEEETADPNEALGEGEPADGLELASDPAPVVTGSAVLLLAARDRAVGLAAPEEWARPAPAHPARTSAPIPSESETKSTTSQRRVKAPPSPTSSRFPVIGDAEDQGEVRGADQASTSTGKV
jgi:hypothetical protein